MINIPPLKIEIQDVVAGGPCHIPNNINFIMNKFTLIVLDEVVSEELNLVQWYLMVLFRGQ